MLWSSLWLTRALDCEITDEFGLRHDRDELRASPDELYTKHWISINISNFRLTVKTRFGFHFLRILCTNGFAGIYTEWKASC